MFLHSTVNLGFAKRASSWEGAMARVDHTRIVSRRLLTNLFHDGIHETERFALMPKSLIVYRRWGENSVSLTSPPEAHGS